MEKIEQSGLVGKKDKLRMSYIHLVIVPEREENGVEAIFEGIMEWMKKD